jgi:hypothetical protein
MKAWHQTSWRRLEAARTSRSVLFWQDCSGGAALVFALSLPVVLGFAGVALDYARFIQHRTSLQSAADAAALAAAREVSVSGPNENRVRSIAESVVRGHISSAVAVKTKLIEKDTAVHVVLNQTVPGIISRIISDPPTQLRVLATAKLYGNRKLCVVALDPTASKSVSLDANSTVTAKACDVLSNSTSPSGVSISGNSRVTATLTCSSGGIAGGSNISGQKRTDCPTMNDPLAERPAPPVGPCKLNNQPIVDQGTVNLPFILTPGTYCGGLKIDGASVVLFTPGVYVIKDGPLQIESNSVVKGDYAGFYFTGTVAGPFVFRASSNSVVDLTAPKEGPLAGVMFFEDRAAPALRPFEVFSNTARTLLGTIYLPRGRFVVRTNAVIADKSAYTVIIARRLELDDSPNLHLNADYHKSDVPVPKGVGPLSGNVHLVR